MVHRLGCLRGVSTLTGFALAVEVGDWQRFTGRTIGSFVGLVPSEHSSGQCRAQGEITKTGNGHARRLLVEAPWHHRSRYQVGRRCSSGGTSPPRRRGSAATKATGGHQRWARFIDRRKRATTANVAITRELAGWCWSLAVLDDQ